MILALLLLPIVAANPFHKYPYVFLLDVGNEELDKVNTEQIRLSSPGGTVAIRYPAIGDGEDIAHVRVSGIDFGTDLKANILDGGPGSKYVVIVLAGNPGVAYDAVVTVQTVSNDISNSIDNEEVPESVEPSDTEGQNTSAEEYDEIESKASQTKFYPNSQQLSQESSNVYYVQNEALNGYGNDDGTDNDEDDENNLEESDDTSEDSQSGEEDNNNKDSSVNEPIAEKYTSNYNQDQEEPIIVDQNLYNKYQALKSHFSGVEVYPQVSNQSDDQNDYSPGDKEYSYDYYEESVPKKYDKDNFVDTDDASAVEF